MNRIKCLVVLSVLASFVVAPSLSSVLSPAPSPGTQRPWTSEMESGGDWAVRMDTARLAADTVAADSVGVAVGKKKKKKKDKSGKLPFWTYYPPALLGYAAYQELKLLHETKKMMKERRERLRDSLRTAGSADGGLVADSLRRVVCPVDTSEAARPGAMAESGTAAGGGGATADNPDVPAKTFRFVSVECRRSSPADVAHCDGTGVCAACGGAKRRYVMSQGEGRMVGCDNCGGTGKCPGCQTERNN